MKKPQKKAMPHRRAPMTREEALATLAEIVRTPVGEINEAHPLAQEVRRDAAGGGDKAAATHVVVKMPDKLAALKTMGAWCGWEKGTEADHKQADAMATLTAWVRSRRRARGGNGYTPESALPAVDPSPASAPSSAPAPPGECSPHRPCRPRSLSATRALGRP